MKIREKECKSILSESGIYSLDYTINPYTGCSHGCVYCYADFMKKYADHDENWGEFVDVKVNAPEILEKDLRKNEPGEILLSSVTDPYLHVEKKYELTRKILKRLQGTKFDVSILTKSDLVLRDLDILQTFSPDQLSVGFTINFLEEKHRNNWEPDAPSIENRLEALEKISNKGIKTYVHVGPYLEGITDLKKLADKFEPLINELQIESLNFKGPKKERIREVIKEDYPELLNVYQEIFRGSEKFDNELKEKAREVKNNYNFNVRLFLG